MTSPSTFDVVVAGAGPAGCLLAAALRQKGLQVALVSPHPRTPWPENHASWALELEGAGLADMLSPVWDAVEIRKADGSIVPVPQRYGLLDKKRLQPQLLKTLEANHSDDSGSESNLFDDRVESVDHHATGSTLTLASGRVLSTWLVVDATGRGHLNAAPRPDATLFQTALGVFVRGVLRDPDASPAPTAVENNGSSSVREGLTPGAMLLMDWRPAPVERPLENSATANEDGIGPTFLYAMPLDDDSAAITSDAAPDSTSDSAPASERDAGAESVWFLEETILIGPSTSPEALRPRLLARLNAHFQSWEAVGDAGVPREEQCIIPMNAPAPKAGRAIAFGAAAGAIHPATGYSVGWSATRVDPLATLIAQAKANETAPDDAATAAWNQLWPPEQRRALALYRKGAEVLARLSNADVSSFFSAFFEQPTAHWSGFMCRTLPVAGVLRAMLGTFLRAKLPVQAKMIRAAVQVTTSAPGAS